MNTFKKSGGGLVGGSEKHRVQAQTKIVIHFKLAAYKNCNVCRIYGESTFPSFLSPVFFPQ